MELNRSRLEGVKSGKSVERRAKVERIVAVAASRHIEAQFGIERDSLEARTPLPRLGITRRIDKNTAGEFRGEGIKMGAVAQGYAA